MNQKTEVRNPLNTNACFPVSQETPWDCLIPSAWIMESLQSQKHKLPAIKKPPTLGQSEILCPPMTTSNCVTRRSKCAQEIKPKMVPATRNPLICAFIFPFDDLFEVHGCNNIPAAAAPGFKLICAS
jgi:hypothetical protein